jgi:hypothetical protein
MGGKRQRALPVRGTVQKWLALSQEKKWRFAYPGKFRPEDSEYEEPSTKTCMFLSFLYNECPNGTVAEYDDLCGRKPDVADFAKNGRISMAGNAVTLEYLRNQQLRRFRAMLAEPARHGVFLAGQPGCSINRFMTARLVTRDDFQAFGLADGATDDAIASMLGQKCYQFTEDGYTEIMLIYCNEAGKNILYASDDGACSPFSLVNWEGVTLEWVFARAEMTADGPRFVDHQCVDGIGFVSGHL